MNEQRDEPQHAQQMALPVQCGDVVLVATDGLFDNLFVEEILKVCILWCTSLSLSLSLSLFLFLFFSLSFSFSFSLSLSARLNGWLMNEQTGPRRVHRGTCRGARAGAHGRGKGSSVRGRDEHAIQVSFFCGCGCGCGCVVSFISYLPHNNKQTNKQSNIHTCTHMYTLAYRRPGMGGSGAESAGKVDLDGDSIMSSSGSDVDGAFSPASPAVSHI